MPLARDLHPEFGYIGSAPRVFRRLGWVLSFVAFGIVAGASGVAVFLASPDSDPATSADPLHAMALAPSEALIDLKPAQPSTEFEKRPANAPSVQEIDEERVKTSRKVGPIKPTCQENLGEVPQGDCPPVRVVRVRPLRAINERPLIAAVPIGHRDDPAMLPAPPTTVSPSPAVPPEEPDTAPLESTVVEATPADAAPAAEPTPPASTPAISSKKPRPRVHHAQDESRHRNHYSYASSHSERSSSEGSWSYSARSSPSSYFQGGYARVW